MSDQDQVMSEQEVQTIFGSDILTDSPTTTSKRERDTDSPTTTSKRKRDYTSAINVDNLTTWMDFFKSTEYGYNIFFPDETVFIKEEMKSTRIPITDRKVADRVLELLRGERWQKLKNWSDLILEIKPNLRGNSLFFDKSKVCDCDRDRDCDCDYDCDCGCCCDHKSESSDCDNDFDL